MTEDGERIASLEAKQGYADDQRSVIFRKLEEQDQDLKAIRSDVHAIREQLSGAKGFWTGITVAVSAIAAVIGGAAAALWQRLFS